ncbi:MAG: KH domain-containing protein [Chlamydiia bacterium]
MDEFIAYLIKNLVSHPDQVDVRSREGERGLLVEIRVAHPDIPKIVGKQGNTIKAIRTIAITAGARIGRRVRLELVEDRAAPAIPVPAMVAEVTS